MVTSRSACCTSRSAAPLFTDIFSQLISGQLKSPASMMCFPFFWFVACLSDSSINLRGMSISIEMLCLVTNETLYDPPVHSGCSPVTFKNNVKVSWKCNSGHSMIQQPMLAKRWSILILTGPAVKGQWLNQF